MTFGARAASLHPWQRAGWLAFALLAIAGMGIALYLTIVRFTGSSIYCTMSDGCEMVNSSKYSKLGPFPVALLGSLWYAGLLELGILALVWKFRWATPVALAATLWGLGFSLYLTYLEIAVIHAICMWCVASLGVMSAMTLIAALQVFLPMARRRGWLGGGAGAAQAAAVTGASLAAAWTEKERLR
jgi:uncharacterized membrane protein